MLENIVKKIKYLTAVGLTALTIGYSGVNCGNKTNEPAVECKIDSDCATGYKCVSNKCEEIPVDNKNPVADAGDDQPLNFDKNCFDGATYDTNGQCASGYNIENNIHPNNKITLDGSLSSDPEGKALQYLWRQISGPSTILSSNGVVKPEFTPSVAGDYVFGLEVSDGVKTSNEDIVNVGIRGNLAPVANAGLDSYSNIAGFTVVNLNGSGSYDKDGKGSINGIQKCEWDFTGDGIYDWNSTSTCSTTYVYPSPGNFNATLRVTDDDGTQNTDIKFVEVN